MSDTDTLHIECDARNGLDQKCVREVGHDGSHYSWSGFHFVEHPCPDEYADD